MKIKLWNNFKFFFWTSNSLVSKQNKMKKIIETKERCYKNLDKKNSTTNKNLTKKIFETKKNWKKNVKKKYFRQKNHKKICLNLSKKTTKKFRQTKKIFSKKKKLFNIKKIST